VGILRGRSLNPYEGQCFEKLPQYGFNPIGITTYDNAFDFSEIHFSKRVGHNFNTITKGKFRRPIRLARRVTGYDFNSWNLMIFDLKKLTADLDILYSADEWYPYTYQAVKTEIPTIIMQWENIAFNPEVSPYSKFRKYNHEHAKHFVAITEKAKDVLILEGVAPDRISVVPACLDCEKFKPQERNEQVAKKLGISEDSIRILFVGRLVFEKGVLDLIKAFSQLLKKNLNVELIIVGSGTPKMQIQIRQLVENLKIGDKVKFLGSIEYSHMPKIHNLADVFCLPSIPTKNWAEQFGYSMVEAMACGKAVISTSSGSIPEVVKDRLTGLLVKPNNPLELEIALEELVKDANEREVFGNNARKWVLQSFEANKIAEKLADIYRKFL
jgi:alpha-maltose-1-phosphate synthase